LISRPTTRKKQGHEGIVDPVLEVLGQRPAAQTDGELGMPEGVVGGLPGGVGPGERGDGGR
jgi:hypothetical protein